MLGSLQSVTAVTFETNQPCKMASARIIVALALVAAVAAAHAPRWDELEGYTFAEYARHHGKHYRGAERGKRAALFTATLAAVRRHNGGAAAAYRMGVNQFADWTAAELAAAGGYRADPAVQRKLRAQAHVRPHVVSGRRAPTEVDYRAADPAVLTAVKDQGYCGSCWAHSAAQAVESHWALATGDLHVLSQQQLTACAPSPHGCGGPGGCSGAYPEVAFEYLVASNATTMASDWTYPYTSYYGQQAKCLMGANSTRGTAVHVDGYRVVAPNDAAAAMDALAFAGPLSIVVDAGGWRTYESGIFDRDDYAGGGLGFDHVVQLVGYGRDADLAMDYWIVRNSWGAAWGEHGYIRLARRPGAERCGNATVLCRGPGAEHTVCGSCGLLFDVLYPTVGAGPAAKTVTLRETTAANWTAPPACDGAHRTRAIEVGRCDFGREPSVFAVGAAPVWFALVHTFTNRTCGPSAVLPGSAYQYFQCDVPLVGGAMPSSVITGCAAANATHPALLHAGCTGCDAAGGACNATVALAPGVCATAAGYGGLVLSSTLRARPFVQQAYKTMSCAGPPVGSASWPCNTCTPQGVFEC
jgi:cathepsin L